MNSWATNAVGNRWHDGDIAGTTSIFVRTSTEFCWAVLTNTRGDRDDAHLNAMRLDLDNLMWTITQHITDWPSFDLF